MPLLSGQGSLGGLGIRPATTDISVSINLDQPWPNLDGSLNTDLSVHVLVSHPSGINTSSVSNSSLLARTHLGELATATITYVGATTLDATTESLEFTVNFPNNGKYTLYVADNGVLANDASASTESIVGSLANIAAASFPKTGFMRYADTVSLAVFDTIDGGILLHGDGTSSLQEQPTSDIRGNCLRLEVTEKQGFQAGLTYATLEMTTGDPVTSSNKDINAWTACARIMFETLPTNDAVEFFEFESSADESPLLRLLPTGEVQLWRADDTQLTAMTSFTVAANEWFEIVIHRQCFQRIGQIYLRRDDESTFTQLFDGNMGIAQSVRIEKLRVGLNEFKATTPGSSVVMWVDKLDVVETDLNLLLSKYQYLLTGSGSRDVSDTAAKIVAVYPDNLIKNATQIRVRYSDDNFATDNVTGFNQISASVHNALPVFDITGLSAGTEYHYRFQICDAVGTVLHETEDYRVRTLATDSSALTFGTTGCMDASASTRPLTSLGLYGDAAEALSDWTTLYFMEDFGYPNNNRFKQEQPFKVQEGNVSTETEVDYQGVFRENCASLEMEKLLHIGTVTIGAGDHTAFNNADARVAPGGPDENSLANGYQDILGTYSATVTVGQLWTRGFAVHDAWFNHLINRANGTARYQVTKAGNTWFMIWDNRSEKRPDLNQTVSATQLTWLLTQLSDFGADSTAQVLHIVMSAAFNDQYTKAGESWEEIDVAGYRQIHEAIHTNIPTTKRVLMYTSDDHIGHYATSISWKDGAIFSGLPYVGEYRTAGVAQALTPGANLSSSNGTYELYRFTDANVQASDVIRHSGLMFKQVAGGAALTVDAWFDNAQILTNASVYAPSVTLVSAVVEDAAPADIVLTYDSALNETSIPAATAYTPALGRTVNAVAISGTTVTLTVDTAYSQGDTVTLDYIVPGVNPVTAINTAVASAFSGQSVTNNIGVTGNRITQLTIPAANLAGTTTLANVPIMINRQTFVESDANDALRDAMFEPGGATAIQADGGDIRIRLRGQSTDLDIAFLNGFSLDSSLGARDSDFFLLVNVPSVDSTVDLELDFVWDTSQTLAAATNALGPNWVEIQGLTTTGSVVDSVDSVRGPISTFSGGYKRTSSAFPLTGSTSRTIVSWVRHSNSNDQAYLQWGATNSGANGERWAFRFSPTMRVDVNGGNRQTGTSVNDGSWHMVTHRLPGTNVNTAEFFTDNAVPISISSTTGRAINTGSRELTWGARDTGSTFDNLYTGDSTLPLIFNVSQADEWIETVYNSQNDPQTFITAGVPS